MSSGVPRVTLISDTPLDVAMCIARLGYGSSLAPLLARTHGRLIARAASRTMSDITDGQHPRAASLRCACRARSVDWRANDPRRHGALILLRTVRVAQTGWRRSDGQMPFGRPASISLSGQTWQTTRKSSFSWAGAHHGVFSNRHESAFVTTDLAFRSIGLKISHKPASMTFDQSPADAKPEGRAAAWRGRGLCDQ